LVFPVISDTLFRLKSTTSAICSWVLPLQKDGGQARRFNRIKRWIETMVKAGLFQEGDSALSYDKDLWLKGVFKNYEKDEFNKRKVVGALLADNFSTSNWYHYYLAVMWYKERFFAICKEQGVDIPR